VTSRFTVDAIFKTIENAVGPAGERRVHVGRLAESLVPQSSEARFAVKRGPNRDKWYRSSRLGEASFFLFLTTWLRHRYTTPMESMPKAEMPSGALVLLILRVLRSGALHGYAIAQRIHVLSSEVLHVEEGSLYPALQKILLKGWVTAEWGISETNRKVRFYRLTPAGRRQLEAELSEYDRVNGAIQSVLRTA